VPTVRELLDQAKTALRAAPFHPAPREAHLLLGHVLGLSEARLLSHDERRLAGAEEEAFRALLARRLTGEPVAYLLGEREFFGRPFAVDPRVLIPRPETEHLVEAVLALPLSARARVLDVGVGSGAIAVTLALERPRWRLAATDVALGALAVARANTRRLGARVGLLGADLAGGVDLATIDLLVSNPPYIAPEEAEGLSPEVTRFEPAGALFAGPEGRTVEGRGAGTVGALLRRAEDLRSGAWVALEIGHRQMPAARRLAATGPWVLEREVTDYSGFDRVAVLRRR
jgi:release factor glutamine methyltransferase